VVGTQAKGYPETAELARTRITGKWKWRVTVCDAVFYFFEVWIEYGAFASIYFSR
jgi:hypothetical protein